jgi:probable HAF family extracellular repeat protein
MVVHRSGEHVTTPLHVFLASALRGGDLVPAAAVPMTRALTCVLGILGWTCISTGQCRYEITLIPDIPCQFGATISMVGLNDSGIAVGSRGDCVFGPPALPVVWTEQDGTSLVEFDGEIHWASAYDVSNNGIVVGTVDFVDDDPIWYHGFYVRDGEVHIIEPPPGMNTTEANGINGSNHIAGRWGNNLTGPMRSCIWIDGELIDLPDFPDGSQANDINDRDHVTGHWWDASVGEHHAYLWSASSWVDLGTISGGNQSRGRALNNRDEVVGTAKDADSNTRAFHWSDGVMTVLPIAEGSVESLAYDISENGTIVGTVDVPGPLGGIAAMWRDGRLFDLNELIEPPRPELRFSQARAINAKGQIVARTIQGAQNYLLTPIDPPPTDLDGDCRTCASDLMIVLSEWNAVDSIADVTGDGVVGFGDLLLLLSEWAADCRHR